ncbi:S-adenosyl-L-methionine-dependent methyltransferase [Suillus subaureus]|uniref:S-adenosyl-L-methionine-dependent methyltransferase n=1 Tax=Suillus subaureus TaxID=48587 RepID=A0A9P7JBW8_9AGAM|nr:S-adenosyl-L-methionine-dependent methyltransferase [Suillus subaureus]KAG1813527.1 S-adenosyl-L-methionine-dependent methyltransferase [Suillus subaureus]
MTDLNEPEAKLEALLSIINSSARQAIAEYKNTGHGVPSADATTFHPLDSATDTIALKKAIRLLEGAYHQLSAILAPPQHSVMNLQMFWTNIQKVLAVDRLAEAVNLDKTKTARILRALSLMGCFKEVERDVFANTRLSLILKSTNNAGCFAGLHAQDISKYAAVLYETPRVLAFRKVGMKGSYWDAIKDDDEKRERFHRSMLGQNEMMGGSAILHHYPWDNISSVVDVGCGIGTFSTPLARMFPHLKITDQDLPEVLLEAQGVWKKNAPEALLNGRVEFVPLNFLEGVPVTGKDVYYLRHVIHDWQDREATTILRNIRKVMGPNSRVLIHDCVLLRAVQEPGFGTDGLSTAPEPILPNFGAGAHRPYQMDITMWLVHNAKERTLDEVKILGASVGLALTQVYDLVDTMVMEFRIA